MRQADGYENPDGKGMKARMHLSDPRQLLAVFFGAGLVPRAPGTAGTAAALPLAWLLSGVSIPVYLVVVAVAFAIGCWICGVTARAAGVHDHPAIVWDEVVGLLLTCVAVPVNPYTLFGAFVLFRFFDIVKPWPIGLLDRHVSGGFGIMVDDAVAGLLAAAALAAAVALVGRVVPLSAVPMW
jgi:phosphatidylglycerophosphatase A